jgi:hypothetical protein
VLTQAKVITLEMINVDPGMIFTLLCQWGNRLTIREVVLEEIATLLIQMVDSILPYLLPSTHSISKINYDSATRRQINQQMSISREELLE